MQKNIFYKWSIDIVSIFFIFIVMAYRLTENSIHEWLGLSLLLLFIVHQMLNRQWYQTIFQGKYNARRTIGTAVILLLLISIIAIIITAIPISRTVFASLKIQNGRIISQLHIFSAYWLFILLAIHLGLHGEMIISPFRKFLRTIFLSENYILLIILRVLILSLIIYGIQSSFSRNIGSKLIMYYTFDDWRLEESVIHFLADYLSIMILYVSGTYYFVKFISTQK